MFRFIARLAAALFCPLPLLFSALAIAVQDVLFRLLGERQACENSAPRRDAVSVVIPTWNGLDLLQKYLPSVLRALGGDLRHEVIVVDNASEDGTVEYLGQHFPGVRVLAQERNLGFGGGSNAGFRAAKNDIVVLLNNDMRVAPDFLAPLLEPFSEPDVFAVACQIFLSDPAKRREETGLTETWWEGGRLVASHRVEPELDVPFPCAYPGGGSSAFDRRKFLQLGGFDEVFRPFYYEDTDLGIMAWKRGWKVLYQPRSVVWHEHRGTIGKKFKRDYIDGVIRRNLLVYGWKNIHDWRILGPGFAHTLAAAWAGTLLGRKKTQHTVSAIWGGCARLREVLATRRRAQTLAAISDEEAFRRQKGGYFRDRFTANAPAPDRLQVLFLSPYHIEPPSHGGAVFMREAIRAMSKQVDVHLLCFVDDSKQIAAHDALKPYCASTTFLVRQHLGYRMPLGLKPRVEIEFASRDYEWAVHRLMQQKQIDLVQIDYAMLAQYRCEYERIPQFLFEHDLSFQSTGREAWKDANTRQLFSYMQLMHLELTGCPKFARVQVCSRENEEYLLGFAPELAGRVDADTRAAIATREYPFVGGGREPDSAIFVGSFNHRPNVQALQWVLRRVWPAVIRERPQAKLYVAGSGSTKALPADARLDGIEVLGFVEDLQGLLLSKAVLISPILTGSGIRVKLLEAFASGIPVVSTRLGAEGLATQSGEYCELADSPAEFAAAVVRLLADPDRAKDMAVRARAMLERERDSTVASRKLVESYRHEVDLRRPAVLKQQTASVSG